MSWTLLDIVVAHLLPNRMTHQACPGWLVLDRGGVHKILTSDHAQCEFTK
jgi:hypothetical protein